MKQSLLLLLLFFSLWATAQNISVTGTVSNAAGQPVSGATVKSSRTAAGTAADEAGRFTISVPANDLLTISSTGYATQTVPVNGATSLVITLQPAPGELEGVVMVGSRSGGRVRTETAVPVDVISTGAANVTGKTDLTSLLNMAAPSFNYNKQSGSDGADAIDLATLRGLGPDHTLVLINGKRRHQTAFVSVFGTRGRGASGTDLNAIPEAAIDRVEILRDGASAQYGSDAIAGVMNLILKKNVGTLSVNAGYAGYWDTKFNTLQSNLGNEYLTGNKIDGNAFKLGASYGIGFGRNGGFATISANLLLQGHTLRQVPDTNLANRDALPLNTVRRGAGDGRIRSGGYLINMELPIGSTSTTFYAFGSINAKNAENYAYSRNFSGRPNRFPTDAAGNLIFVEGIMRRTNPADPNSEVFFNPLIEVRIEDNSTALGFRGKLGNSPWRWDLSNTSGRNSFDYFVNGSFNASLPGAQSAAKTSFQAGGFQFNQNTVNGDISRRFDGVGQGLNLSFGAEARFETYRIFAGEEASYRNYNPDKAGGSQGFPGFQPGDQVTGRRTNVGAYADAELDATDKLLLGAAVRVENYSDFGALATFKFNGRYKIAPNFNLRGSISTGYRAPSLQQINFSNTFTNVQGGRVFEVKIAPNTSPITRAAGIPELQEEKSVNASLGFTWKPAPGWTLTIDGYSVRIKDRVVLSGQFDTTVAALRPTLLSLNVSQAQFYANAIDTRNTGLDIVLNYTKTWGGRSFKALLAGNLQRMKITNINVPAALDLDYDRRQAFFSDREQSFVLASAPPAKFNLNLDYNFGKLGVGTHFTYFGEISLLGYGYDQPYPPLVTLDNGSKQVLEEFVYSPKLVSDLYFSYKLSPKASLYWGADNIFNVHPDYGIVPGARLSAYDGEAGAAWDPVQMGYNGRRLFARVALNL